MTQQKKETKQERKKEKQYKKEHHIPTFGSYLRPHKFVIATYLLLMVITTCVNVEVTLITAEILTAITMSMFQRAMILLGILFAILLFSRLLRFVMFALMSRCQKQIVSIMSQDLASQSFKISSLSYSNNSTGTFLRRIMQEPRKIFGQASSIINMIASVTYAFVIMVYLLCMNYVIGIALVVGVIIIGIIERFRLKSFKKNMKKFNIEYDKSASLTNEIIKSEKDVKSLGLENALQSTITETYEKYNEVSYRFSLINQSFLVLSHFFYNVLSVGVCIIGLLLLDKAMITMASFMFIYTNKGAVQNLSIDIASIFEKITSMRVSAESMFDLYDDRKFPTEKFGNIQVDTLQGNITFSHVGFAYKDESTLLNSSQSQPNTTTPSKKVLDDLSFTIPANTTVAFVGKSGSGKTTILSLISKLQVAQEGEILLDTININDLTKDSLRNNISLVNQFPYIFNQSIKDNLLMAKPNATQEELWEAVEKSYLKEFVDQLPNGLDTIVGESGIKLSGGQRQRLAIARAILRHSSIMIFDESTSSLDNYAQEYIKKSIDHLKGSSTIIIVAHRLSTIKNVDKIYFLDDGKIIDSGTFDELFQKNETFKKMFLIETL